MLRTEYLDIHLFLRDMALLKLFDAVAVAGGAVRVVGGAVRDALVGKHGSDINLATNLSPEELVEACQDAGIQTVPYGLKTSTTGVLINDHVYEVSSLWQKQSANERLMSEGYTDDWKADASRRDLTINAIYADEKGNVFDYYNGIADLETGHIRFIGQAAERIQEYPIRIMRFFRFYSCFGKGAPDTESLRACVQLKSLLRHTGIEQVRDELFKIFMTPNICPTLKIIFQYGVLDYILPQSERLPQMKRLIETVASCGYEPDALRRLYVLYRPDAVLAESLTVRLHLSKVQRKRFIRWAKADVTPQDLQDYKKLVRMIYEYGTDFCIDQVFFAVAEGVLSFEDCQAVLARIQAIEPPVFPLTGSKLLAEGVTDQVRVGACLAALREQWIRADFSLTPDELLDQARKGL